MVVIVWHLLSPLYLISARVWRHETIYKARYVEYLHILRNGDLTWNNYWIIRSCKLKSIALRSYLAHLLFIIARFLWIKDQLYIFRETRAPYDFTKWDRRATASQPFSANSQSTVSWSSSLKCDSNLNSWAERWSIKAVFSAKLNSPRPPPSYSKNAFVPGAACSPNSFLYGKSITR